MEEEFRLAKKYQLFSSRPSSFILGWGSRTLNLVYNLPDVFSNKRRDYLTSITLPHGQDDDWLGTLGDLSSRVPLADNVTWVLDNHARHGSRIALRIETFSDNDIVAVVERFERPAKFILSKHQHGPLALKLSPPENHSSYKWLLYVADKPLKTFDVGKYGAQPSLEGVDPHDYFHVHETFGEQMLTIKWPKAFVANNHGDTFQVNVMPPHNVVFRAIFDEHECASSHEVGTDEMPTFRLYLLSMELVYRRYGLVYCANRPKRVMRVSGVMAEDHKSCKFVLNSITETGEMIGDIACHKGWLFALMYQSNPPWAHEFGGHSGPARLVCAPGSHLGEWHDIPGMPLVWPANRLMRNEFLSELHTLLVPTLRNHKPGWIGIHFGQWDGSDVPRVCVPGRVLDHVVDFISHDADCFRLTTAKTEFNADIKFTHFVFSPLPSHLPTRKLDRTIKWFPNARHEYQLGLDWSSVPGFCYRRRGGERRPGRPRIAMHLHGGPNSLCYRAYIPSQLMVADEMDWDLILYPNYRGSLGVSESWTAEIFGHVGTIDVSDCRKFLLDHLALVYQGKIDAAKSDEEIWASLDEDERPLIVCMGGSHGGFIAAHLLGQHPRLFAAGVLMNPVTDLVTGAGTSDIPDVLNFEADAHTHILTPAAERLHSHSQIVRRDLLTKCSPILWVTEVEAPVVIFLGGSDMRVHSSQGREFYHALRSLGKPCELYFYPEANHSILEPRNSEHFTLTTVQFLRKYLTFDEHVTSNHFSQALETAAKQFHKPHTNPPESVLFMAK